MFAITPIRALVLIALCPLLLACEQVVNRGPVGGAALSVVPLRGGAPVYTAVSSTPESVIASEGETRWDEGSDLQRLQKLGRSSLPASLPVAPEAWYVIVASGGQDFDIDRDGVIESATGTPVQGELHALVRGAQLGTTALAISPLTEAAYQFLIDYVPELSDAEIGEALDELAPDLVADSNGSGSVDYDDVLFVNRLLATDDSLSSASVGLEALAEAVAAGAPQGTLRLQARELSRRRAPRRVAERFYAELIHQAVIVGKQCTFCHLEGGLGARASNNVVVLESDPDYARVNTENFRRLVEDFSVQGVLDKARGIGHGGGAWIAETDPEYADFEAWLKLL